MRCSSVLCSLALTFGIVAPVAVTAQGGSVAGIVVSRGSGAPVGDAQITVTGTALRAFTDASGRFHFDDVAGTTAVLQVRDRKSTRLNSSHGYISYAVFCLKKKKKKV